MADTDGTNSRPLALVPKETDLEFYRRQLVQGPGKVLVLGCATGRIAWALAHQAEVVAVDSSERMLAAAEAQRETEPAEAAQRLKFVRSDLRALRLSERFSWVVAPQNALGGVGTLEDLEAVLATVREHLAPGASFIYDVRQAPPATARTIDEPGMPAFLEPPRPAFTPHLREAKAGPIRRLLTRSFTAEELEAAFQRAGLSELERYGNFAGKPLDEKDELRVGVATGA